MGTFETASQEPIDVLYRRAHLRADRDAAVSLDQRLYLVVIDIALREGWKLARRDVGQERLRHVGRLALAMHLDPALWSACRSCSNDDLPLKAGCNACHGSGSVLITLDQFRQHVGETEYEGVWRNRIEVVAAVISAWANEG